MEHYLSSGLILMIFIISSLLMFLRKIPALLALPIMAILMPLCVGIQISDVFNFVIGQGSLKLNEAYTIAIFGGILSILLQKTGVAESFIKKGAELSGDNPFLISVLMLLLIALLFTTIGGLGAIIMVATIVLPIMISVGISPLATAGIFLFGLSIGGILNPTNWALYTGTLKLQLQEITPFAVQMFLIAFFISLVYIVLQLKFDGANIKLKKIIFSLISLFAIIFVLNKIFTQLPIETQKVIETFLKKIWIYTKLILIVFIIFAFVYNIYRLFTRKSEEIHWLSYFTPIIPLLFILLFNIHPIGAFTIGIFYCFISTYKKNHLNLLIKSMFEGSASVMPAVILMLGIGMLLVSIMGPDTSVIKLKVQTDNSGNAVIYFREKNNFKIQNINDLIIKFENNNGAKIKYNLSSNLDKLYITSSQPNKDLTIEIRNWRVLAILQPIFSKIVPQNGFSYFLIFTLLAPLSLYRGPLNVWGMGYPVATIFLSSGMPAIAIMALLISVGQIQGISDPTNTQNVWLANELQIDVQKILWNTLPFTWIMAIFGLLIASIQIY